MGTTRENEPSSTQHFIQRDIKSQFQKMSESVKAAAPRVPCTLCDKDYVNKQGLNYNMKKSHTVSQETTTVAPATEDTDNDNVAPATDDTDIVAPVTDNTMTVASATEDTTTVAAATELNKDDDVMREAKEEQDLYDSLDELIKKIDDPEQGKDSKEELLEKVKRLQTIVKKKTELLTQKKDCTECVKREEVERNQECLL